VRFLNGLFDFGSLESLPGFTMPMVKLYGKAGLPRSLVWLNLDNRKANHYDSLLEHPKSMVK
jgi:hypothetical protein